MDRGIKLLMAACDNDLVLDRSGAGADGAAIAALGAGLACGLRRIVQRGNRPDSVHLGKGASVYANSGSAISFGVPWMLPLDDIVSALQGHGLRLDLEPKRLRLFGPP